MRHYAIYLRGNYVAVIEATDRRAAKRQWRRRHRDLREVMIKRRYPIMGSAGHNTDYDAGYYIDTKEPLSFDPKQRRPCMRCGLPPTVNGDDPCLANLPRVAYASCGHGGLGYVKFDDGTRITFNDKTGDEIRQMVAVRQRG